MHKGHIHENGDFDLLGLYSEEWKKVEGKLMNPDIGTSSKYFEKKVYGDILYFAADKYGNYKNKVRDPYVNLFGEWSALGKMIDIHFPYGTKE